MATDYERLNNAIVKASMRGGVFAQLAADWKDEVTDEQNWKIALPLMWSSTLKYYWARYAELYGKDPNRLQLTNPYDVAPQGVSQALKDLWKPAIDMGQGAAKAAQDKIDSAVQAAKSSLNTYAAEVGAAAAKGAQDSTNQWLWAAGFSVFALGGAYWLSKRLNS